jgi:hypothetical protein
MAADECAEDDIAQKLQYLQQTGSGDLPQRPCSTRNLNAQLPETRYRSVRQTTRQPVHGVRSASSEDDKFSSLSSAIPSTSTAPPKASITRSTCPSRTVGLPAARSTIKGRLTPAANTRPGWKSRRCFLSILRAEPSACVQLTRFMMKAIILPFGTLLLEI